MQNSVAKKIFAVGSAVAMTMAMAAPFAAHAAVHAAGTNVVTSDGTVWMVMPDGTRRAYTSAGAFLSYGFNSWSQVVPASAEDLALPAGSYIPPQDGSIICSNKGSDMGTCYEISGSQKFGFTSAAVFTGLGFSFTNSMPGDVSWMTMNATLLNNTTASHVPGTLVNNNGTVQLMGISGLLGIPDVATFNSWGYSFNKVVFANAADKAMTQTGVMATRIAGQLSPTGLANTGNNPPVLSGNVSASLSSDTPVTSSIVAGQAIADLAHFAFSGTGTVTQVVLKRIGVSSDDTLTAVYLYNGNTKLTDAGSVSNSTVTFSNSAGLFTVNGNMTISVKADIKAGVSGQTIGVQLSSFTVASGTPMSTSISGNLMNVASVTNLATVAATASSTIGSSINAGTINSTLWGATFNVGQRNVQLKYLALKQVGSVPTDALQNLQLYIAGSPVGTKVSVSSNNDIIFDLTGSPATMQTGSVLVEVRGDVVKGSSRTFSLRLQSPSDMVVVDTNYGVNLLITATAAGMGFPITAGDTTVSSGSLSVQSDATYTTTQLVKNASNATLGQWTMKAYGEDVKVQNLQVKLSYFDLVGTATTSTATEGFNNLTVYVNGGAVGSSQSALFNVTNCTGNGTTTASVCTYTFGSTNLFTIPAGTQVTFSVKGDSVLDSNTKVASVRTDLIVPSTALQGVTSFNTLSSGTGTYTGTSLTIASSSATLARNASFANGTINSNALHQKIGSYTISASNAEGVRVTSLTVGVSGTLGFASTNALANLTITTPSGSATPVNPSGSNNFSVDFSMLTSQTATVDVYADVTNATGTITTTMSGAGTGSSSGQSVNLAQKTGQTVTVGNGTLTNPPTLNTGASPVSQFVVGGGSSQPIAVFNFVSTNGGSTITELRFSVTGSFDVATDTPITSVTVGGQTQPVVNSGTAATVSFTGLNIAVPSGNQGLDVPVTVNFASVGTNGIVSNNSAILTMTYVKYSSGGQTNSFSNPSGAIAPTMYVVGSKPSVSLAAPSGSLSLGTVPIASVTVTADAAGNIKLVNLPIIVATSGTVTLAATSTQVFVNGTRYTSVTETGFNTAGADVITFTGGYTVTPGSPVTFVIYATIGGSLGASGTSGVSTQISPQSSFTWTDVIGGVTPTGAHIANFPSSTVNIHN
jgi:hypothetical protein